MPKALTPIDLTTLIVVETPFEPEAVNAFATLVASDPRVPPLTPRHYTEVSFLSRPIPTLSVLVGTLRERMGLSQARLAQQLCVHVGCVRRMETGAQQGVNSETKAMIRDLCRRHPDLLDIFTLIDWPKRGQKPGTY